MPKLIKTLYWIAFLDAFALLALVVFGLPLKYGYNFPLLVKILGPTHGTLFLLLTLTLITALAKKLIKPGLAALVFVMAVLPFGGFYADYKLKLAYYK